MTSIHLCFALWEIPWHENDATPSIWHVPPNDTPRKSLHSGTRKPDNPLLQIVFRSIPQASVHPNRKPPPQRAGQGKGFGKGEFQFREACKSTYCVSKSRFNQRARDSSVDYGMAEAHSRSVARTQSFSIKYCYRITCKTIQGIPPRKTS